jgi:hypothetical protein
MENISHLFMYFITRHEFVMVLCCNKIGKSDGWLANFR